MEYWLKEKHIHYPFSKNGKKAGKVMKMLFIIFRYVLFVYGYYYHVLLSFLLVLSLEHGFQVKHPYLKWLLLKDELSNKLSIRVCLSYVLKFDRLNSFLSTSSLWSTPLCEVCSSFRSLISTEKICWYLCLLVPSQVLKGRNGILFDAIKRCSAWVWVNRTSR